MKSFETAIRKALQPLPKGKCFEIYKLTTEPKECTPLVPSHDGKTTVSHSLILVSVRDDGEIKESHSAFLCGLETYEYITVYPDEKKQTTVYISKVDTTGYPSSKITGRLVRAYLQSLGPCHVHVFARAQPQYLFAKSAHNKAKIPLSDRALVGWWYRLLSDALPSASVSAAWWSVPGLDDASSAMLEIGQGGNRKKQTDITWQYGYPYEKEAAADQVIPRFDDDPKTRVIKHLIDQNTNGDDQLSVQDFWHLLGIGEECGAGRLTGFFVLHLGQEQDPSPVTGTSADQPVQDQKVPEDIYTRFWNDLMDRDFSTDEKNKTSSQHVLNTWTNLSCGPPCVIHTTGPAPSLDESKPSAASAPRIINTLPMTSIKRKAPITLSSEALKRNKQLDK